MPEFEKKLLIWLQKHMEILLMAGLTACAILLRYPLCGLHADIPGNSLNKLMSFADIFPAAAAYILIRMVYGKGEKHKAVIAFSIMLFSAGNVFASAVYGRMDALWCVLCVLALAFIIKEKYLWAFALFSLACFISAYALLILPFFFFVYMYKGKFSIFGFTAPVAAAVIRCFAVPGAAGWLPAGFVKGQLYDAYPSFWGFIREDSTAGSWFYLPLAFVMALAMLMIFFMVFCRRKYSFEKDRLIWIAFLTSFIMAAFMPGMGMGAAAMTTTLAWLTVFTDPVLIIPALLMEVLRIWPQAAEIYGREWMAFSIQGLCWIHMGVMLFYILYFKKKVLDSGT